MHPSDRLSISTFNAPHGASQEQAVMATPNIRIRIRIAAMVCAVLGTSTVARAQWVDNSFDPGVNGYVHVVAVQADGKILVGGWFTALGGGGTGTTPRSGIGRFNADGSLDTSFDPGAGGPSCMITTPCDHTMAVQADGTIL